MLLYDHSYTTSGYQGHLYQWVSTGLKGYWQANKNYNFTQETENLTRKVGQKFHTGLKCILSSVSSEQEYQRVSWKKYMIFCRYLYSSLLINFVWQPLLSLLVTIVVIELVMLWLPAWCYGWHQYEAISPLYSFLSGRVGDTVKW